MGDLGAVATLRTPIGSIRGHRAVLHRTRAVLRAILTLLRQSAACNDPLVVADARTLPSDRIPGSAYRRERPANAADAASRATARRRISRAGRGMHEKALQEER